jgi:putative endonuclease
MSYFVYMVECKDKTFYTGSTVDVQKRLLVHNTKKTGAAYTKARRPVTLVYTEECSDRSEALKREHVIKQLSRSEKQSLIDGYRLSEDIGVIRGENPLR